MNLNVNVSKQSGGVTACRSDVINNLRTIKWHMVAEAANDFGIPKRQIERNVHSLKIIPIWGLDLMTPTHGLFANRLDSELDHITTHTTLLDIEHTFVPILAAMISGARALDFSTSDVKQVTRALVNLNAYFKDSRHWGAVWKSDVVKTVSSISQRLISYFVCPAGCLLATYVLREYSSQDIVSTEKPHQFGQY
jgi:hypothetical protein